MLNIAFSKKIVDKTSGYILPDETISALVAKTNESFDTGIEVRVQDVYGFELWEKIYSLNFTAESFFNKDVLDLACGTGYVSYHFLKKVAPKSLTLIDISPKDLQKSEELLKPYSDKCLLKYVVSDAIKIDVPDNSFDYILGNSFLHHFYDLPRFILEIKRILRPGGVFIALHEPTIASLALESRNPKNTMYFFLKGDKYADIFRYKGDGVMPGGGGDVWMFKKNELAELFDNAGFREIKTENWHFFRPKIVAIFSLHLSKDRPFLNFFEKLLLNSAIRLDILARKILPDFFFGSVALSAKK